MSFPHLAFVFALACSMALSAERSTHSLLAVPDAWFRSDEGRKITENILSFQSNEGSWPKNTNFAQVPFTGERSGLHGTFDNSATTDELRFLARAYNATQNPACQAAFLKGLAHVLKAQYPTGGWPQYYPPPKTYHGHITFNDNAMVRLMEFLREVANRPTYEFVGQERREAARKSFEAGVGCILKCQIRVDGKLTAWCAQHDELDYVPRPGRAFELASISGSESVGILRLLMSLENPPPEVVRAVEAATAWLDSVKLSGIREIKENQPQSPKGWNKMIINAPNSPGLWARFYEVGTNKPLFADRDGVPKYSLADIGYERRNGYAWYGDWPASLLAKDYPAWKKKIQR
jgi:PelA/Pel-15E family pectate lyase